jgi:predicted phosphodiesterase
VRAAAIYDIHGNLPALEAVLAEVRTVGVDAVVVGGDVMPGPMAGECLSLLQSLPMPVHCLRGNGELAVIDVLAGRVPKGVPEAYRPPVQWNAEQLIPEHVKWIAEWPRTVRLTIDGLGEVLFCHATPRDEYEIFTSLTPEDPLIPIFTSLGADVVICGHTHMQFDRHVGATRVVNAGSVGMPFGEPGADWLLLGPEIEFRHTSYNLHTAAERVRVTAFPGAEGFASGNIVTPPAAETMLAMFTKAQLN